MGNTTKKSKSLKCGVAIKSLSLISLGCTVLSCGGLIFGLISHYFYWLYSPNIISLLLTLVSIVLLVLYVFKFYSKLKATVLVPIIFGFIGLGAILSVYYFGGILSLLILLCSIPTVISALKGFNKKYFLSFLLQYVY